MVEHFRRLADDPLRLSAFQRAIAEVVRPGDVVADIGCGLGTFSIFASRAGAARVYAVEESAIVEVAREVVRANGCADRVRFVTGRSHEIAVPERARVVIFEDYVSGLLTTQVARTLKDLVARWLEPGGTLLPARARLWAAPVEDAEGHHALDRFAFTHERVAGVDLGPTRRGAFSMPQTCRLPAAALLAAPALVREQALAEVRDATLQLSVTVEASRDGAVHALLLWFDLELGSTWLGTGPLSPTSAWWQLRFALERPLEVQAGRPLAVQLQAAPFGDQLVWRWSVTVGQEVAQGNSLEGTPMRADLLALSREDHVPRSGSDLEIDRAVLAAVDGRRSVGEIARLVAASFPEKLGAVGEAVARVGGVLARYGSRD